MQYANPSETKCALLELSNLVATDQLDFLTSQLIQAVVDLLNEARLIVIDSAVVSEPDLHASIAVMAAKAN